MSTLDCTLRLENLNGKLVCRETRGVLVLCRHQQEGKEEKQLLRVRMQNANNRQIELGKNTLKIWRQHIKQGKATIQFKEDNLMLYISMVKYEKLRSFLSQIENIGEIENSPKNLPTSPSKQQSSSSAIILDENRFRTKMTITKLKDYPKNGFPKNLQQLYIDGIKLQNVDIRWFSLNSLSILSLVDNNLGKNWTLKNWRRFCAISNLTQLSELYLSKNPLKIIPDFFIDAIPSSLTVLSLAWCSLVYFSNRITRLRNLQSLNLNKNLLKELPEDLYLLPRLNKLQISEMPYLQYLPATFNAMSFIHRGKFDELDVSNNPLLVTHNEELLIENIVLTIPKLVDLASASLLNYPQYWVDDGSQLLRQEILDCLPVTLHNEIRKGLLRCQYCSKLHPSSLVFYFFRVGSINLIAHTYIGPIGYLVRSQSCKKCGNTVKRVVFRWV